MSVLGLELESSAVVGENRNGEWERERCDEDGEVEEETLELGVAVLMDS